ncbi:MAG: 3-carboxy-cis,cis-muconate cycloisomerase, partial [Sporichthyaceae bacterium]|nr:3-carboxy-cis,cis-muconate cycloisomerase [Sporichthyaceae bacterium]
AVGDRAWLAAMLAVEAALAESQAGLGLIPDSAAAAIGAACTPDRFDLAALAEQARGPGNPVLLLVQALRAALPDSAAKYVHYGATSQDVLDTAAMLTSAAATDALLAELGAIADAVAALADEHRDTPMAGRTLLQHAMPVTLGLKAAGWLVALDAASDRLAEVRSARLAVQLGGAAGSLDGFGTAGPELLAGLASRLGLATPVLPWHTDRTRIAELAGALATTAGVLGKIARDIVLLAQSEVAEVTEAAPGGSSAMPHKRNPVAAVSALAAASQAPGLAATLYASMVQEHERGAGGWQAEWRPLRELHVAVGSAAAWLRDSVTGLVVDRAALAVNLARLAVTAELADPAARIGAAAALVDRALAAHTARRGT